MSTRRTVNGYLEKMGGLGPLDDDGRCTLVQGNARVVVKVNEAANLLTVAAPVIKLPRANLLPLYRRLLLLNREMTGDAAFCLDDYEDAVELRIKRPLRDLGFHDFAHAVDTVAVTADRYNDVLAEEFGARIEAVPAAAVSGMLTTYADAINPAAAAKRAARVRGRHEALATVFWLVGLLAGLAAAYYVHTRIGSWWLDFFVLWVVAYFVGRGIPSIITHRGKVVRTAYFLLIPVLATLILYSTHALWGRWWLSVVLGLAISWILAPLISLVITPAVVFENLAEGEAVLHESLSGEA